MSLRIVDFFGLPVTFRVEARKNTAAVILSLRSHDKERIDGNGAIVYEHPPRIVTQRSRLSFPLHIFRRTVATVTCGEGSAGCQFCCIWRRKLAA